MVGKKENVVTFAIDSRYEDIKSCLGYYV